MQDLLSDINAAAPGQQGQQQQGGTSDEKDDVLASLERELAGLTAGGAPPGLGGGGGPPGLTAASLVVSHTADRAHTCRLRAERPSNRNVSHARITAHKTVLYY